ncbi:MAG: UPF0262 family protein, partial [Pseudomonadota bacterium]
MSAETPPGDDGARSPQRLSALTLDEQSIGRTHANIEHEREVAIFDILEENSFALTGEAGGVGGSEGGGSALTGPYRLELGLQDDRLRFRVSQDPGEGSDASGGDGAAPLDHMVPLAPLRRIVKDYFLVCESYYEAIKTSPPSQIQLIDEREVDNSEEQSLIEASEEIRSRKLQQETERWLMQLRDEAF